MGIDLSEEHDVVGAWLQLEVKVGRFGVWGNDFCPHQLEAECVLEHVIGVICGITEPDATVGGFSHRRYAIDVVCVAIFSKLRLC